MSRVSSRIFILNFGSLAGRGFLFGEGQRAVSDCIEANRAEYGTEELVFRGVVDGLIISVYAQDVHRSIVVEQAAMGSRAMIESVVLFDTVFTLAQVISRRKYSLLGFNCVTACSQVLRAIDEAMCREDCILPGSLDQDLHSYRSLDERCVESSTLRRFYHLYENHCRHESCIGALFANRTFMHLQLGSVLELVQHIHSDRDGYSGKRSKQVLLDHGWIQSKTQGASVILVPGEHAPDDFAQALRDYNKNKSSPALPVMPR